MRAAGDLSNGLGRRGLWLAASAAAILAVLSAAAVAQERLSVARITSYPTLSGTPPFRPIWSPDGKRLAFLWNDQGQAFRDIWLVDAQGTAPRKLTDMARMLAAARAAAGVEQRSGPAVDPGGTAALKGQLDPALVQAAAMRANPGILEIVWTADSQSLIFNLQGMLFRIGADGSNQTRLTPSPTPRSGIALSPDGKVLSYLQAGDLWFLTLATGEAKQMTQIAKAEAGAARNATEIGYMAQR